MEIFTIGHSNRSAAELLALLRENAIATVADVRRFPVSRRFPQHGRARLEATLAEVTEWGNERSEAINIEDRQRIVESGRSEITVLTPEQLAVWQTAMRPVWDQFRDGIGADLVEAALRSAQ